MVMRDPPKAHPPWVLRETTGLLLSRHVLPPIQLSPRFSNLAVQTDHKDLSKVQIPIQVLGGALGPCISNKVLGDADPACWSTQHSEQQGRMMLYSLFKQEHSWKVGGRENVDVWSPVCLQGTFVGTEHGSDIGVNLPIFIALVRLNCPGEGDFFSHSLLLNANSSLFPLFCVEHYFNTSFIKL